MQNLHNKVFGSATSEECAQLFVDVRRQRDTAITTIFDLQDLISSGAELSIKDLLRMLNDTITEYGA